MKYDETFEPGGKGRFEFVWPIQRPGPTVPLTPMHWVLPPPTLPLPETFGPFIHWRPEDFIHLKQGPDEADPTAVKHAWATYEAPVEAPAAYDRRMKRINIAAASLVAVAVLLVARRAVNIRWG